MLLLAALVIVINMVTIWKYAKYTKSPVTHILKTRSTSSKSDSSEKDKNGFNGKAKNYDELKSNGDDCVFSDKELKPSESLSNISTFSASYFMPRTLIE
jgi:hypothetical protein